jgi:hypothetical protein
MPRAMPYRFGGYARRPPQPAPEPEVEPDPDTVPSDAADQAEAEIDPFAEDDVLAAMNPADFYRQLRAQAEKVKSGELPVEAAHPLPKQRPRSKRYKRRDKHGREF